MAAPFGPAPGVATTCFVPSGSTRVSVPPATSTRITDPSAIATGPSGNFRPSVISRISLPRVSFALAGSDPDGRGFDGQDGRSEEHTSELQSLMRISYAVFCLKKKKQTPTNTNVQ